MAISFFIPFAIALIAAVVGYRSREEIVTVFSAIIAAVSLFLSFVLAPWLVQISILLAGLAGMRYFCHRHSCQNSLENQPK